MRENRKVRLTKRVLKDALVELLWDKDLSEISVTELCGVADVNRSTFYSHYRDLAAILDELEEVFVKHVSYLSAKDSHDQQRQRFKEYIAYVQKHKDEFIVLLKNGRMIQKVTEHSMELYREEISRTKMDEMQVRKHACFVQYACVGTFQMIACWLKEENLYTVDELAQWVLELTIRVSEAEQATI